MKAILRELELRRDYLEGERIETIYLGGGTPSLLTSDELSRLFEVIYKCYDAGTVTECTLEANPDDLDRTYIKALCALPVNRLSIGVQSFRDEDLRYMKRAHDAKQADYAIKAAQDAGFGNLSIDLIYGVPGMSDREWTGNIERVRELAVPHFSAYALTVEEKTELHHSIVRGKAEPVDAAQAAKQFEILMDAAEDMGYEHYEISNLALPGRYAVHNTAYWQGKKYLGVGPSAHSFNGSARSWNVANNALYAVGVLQQSAVPAEEERLTTRDKVNEYIMTSLRTMWGCNLTEMELRWGGEYPNAMMKNAERFLDRGWLVAQEKRLILTRQGKLFADKVAAELFFER